MEWRYFTDTAERLKILTKKLKEETDKIEQKYKSYWELLQEELGTYEEWKAINELSERLKEIQAELRNVQEKAASKKILINFAGITGSGKSSLINALLQSRRLPVGFMQTTMCLIKVCTTEDEEWSVTVKKENGETVSLARSTDENYVRALLSKMSGKIHADDRKKMEIGTRSVVQVNWPERLCEVLPLNVVLIDTPGLGEDDESDKVITESCRKADIIVAVMDVGSPLKTTVARLVNNVNCQFTFGVFTKWDECKRKEEEESEDTVDVNQTREGYEQDFQSALNGQCEMFFVDVKYSNTNDAAFKEFERKLQASATILKGESLINQAKSVIAESIKIVGELKHIVDVKEKRTAASIKEENDSINNDEDSFNELKSRLELTHQLMEGAYNENTKRIKDFVKGVTKGKPEDVVHAEFIDRVDKSTQDTLDIQRNEMRSAFTKWANDHNWDIDVNEFVSDEIPQCETQGLTDEEYDRKWDPNVYYTNNYLASALLLGGSFGGAIAGAAGFVSWAGMIAAESLPTMASIAGMSSVVGGTGGLGGTLIGFLHVGDLVRWYFPISDYKISCWKEKLRGKWLKLYKSSKDLILNDIKRIQDKASKELDHSTSERLKKIEKEQEKLSDLTTWSKELEESHTRLRERNKEFDDQLTELLRAEMD